MAEEEDDEFSYAFEGKARDGPSKSAQKFVPVEMPRHLVTDVKQRDLAIVEEVEEEDGGSRSDDPTPSRARDEEKELAEDEVLRNSQSTAEASSATDSSSGRGGNLHGSHENRGVKGAGKVEYERMAPLMEKEAEREWEEVMQIREQEAVAGEGDTEGAQATPPKVAYSEAEKYFEGVDMSSYKESIILQEPQLSPRAVLAGFLSCFGLLTGPFLQERVHIFCLAKLQFSDAEPMHVCILHSIYMTLTGASRPMPRFGRHWDDIGFQGTDPATDLRGGGMLGLLQLLHLTDCHSVQAFTMWHLSRDEVQGYPFAVVSINITKWALEALRSNLLSREIHRHHNVIKVLNAFYVGAFLEFHTRWKAGQKTMVDSGYMLHELEKSTKRIASKIVQKAIIRT